MEQQGIYERIKARVEGLKEESGERFFTEYLVKLDRRLIQEKHQLDLMETELERNCQIYRQRMASARPAVRTAAPPAAWEPAARAAVQPGAREEAARTEASAGARGEAVRTEAPAGTQGEAVRTEAPAETRGEAVRTEASAGARGEAVRTEAPAGTQGEAVRTEAPAGTQGEAARTEAPAETRGDARATSSQGAPREAVHPGTDQKFGTYSSGNISQQAILFQPQAESRPRKNHEFTIGIDVFGTIGVLFVLAALILLGINYMGSLVNELGLYALGLLVWGVAEFVVRKKSPTLSMIFSSLGIGSLYVTTMVNFLYLHNFNGLATILITSLITVAVMVVSRKKDAGILRIICIGACMVSFLMMDTLHMVSDVELLIYMIMILLVQLLGIFLPVKRWAYGIAVGQMAGTAVFAWIFAITTVPPEEAMELRALYVIGFVVLSLLLMELTVWKMPAENEGQMQGICITFGIGAFLLLWAYCQCASGMHGTYSDIEIWIRLGVMAAIAVMGILFFSLTGKKGYLRWMQGYLVAGAALLLFGCGSRQRLSVTITLTLLVVLYKLLAYRQKPLRVADAVITTWTALAALVYYDSVYGYVLLGVLLLGILFMNHWQTYYELLLTGTAVLYISMAVDNELLLPLMIAVMWLATLLFNYRYAGKGIKGYNVTVLVAEVSGYLGLISFRKYDSVVIYLILTVLGLGIILFTFQPRILHMAERWRGLASAGFLTYMVLVTRFGYRITSSILLMVVGLLGIAFGFRQADRKLRIYGLVLCMLMCFKITLFDFRVQSLQRIILFLAAGAVALLISGIYALMEKKYNREIENLETQGREQGR